VTPDDFFIATEDYSQQTLDSGQMVFLFNNDVTQALWRGPLEQADDLDAATALATVVHDELLAFGTDSSQKLTEYQSELALRTLGAVLKRLDIEFVPPFRSFSTFKTYWKRMNMAGSWDARRQCLSEIFEPLHNELIRREDQAIEASLAEPASPQKITGWPAVDAEVRELRRAFRSATSAQAYRAVGSHCVGVVEALALTVYDPAKHLRDGETEPGPDKTKQRLERYIEVTCAGPENEDLRGLARKAIEFAQHVKHATGTRREAGIAADSVILLANILKRLEQEF
jgi:hypothetical protein